MFVCSGCLHYAMAPTSVFDANTATPPLSVLTLCFCQADAMLARLSEQQDAIVAQVAQRRENDAALQKRVKDAKETMKLVLASGGGADE